VAQKVPGSRQVNEGQRVGGVSKGWLLQNPHYIHPMKKNECNRDVSPILPIGSDGCVYNSVPVQLKVQIVCYERVQTGLSITVPHGG